MSLNRATLIGHTGKDPEVRYLESGIAVATISLATTEKGYTLTNGTQVPDRTEWHSIVAWRGLAEIAEKYIKKGSQIYVEGKITTRKWEKDGVTRYTTEIQADKIELLGHAPDRAEQEPAREFGQPDNRTTQAGTSAAANPAPTNAPEPEPGSNDDLPF